MRRDAASLARHQGKPKVDPELLLVFCANDDGTGVERWMRYIGSLGVTATTQRLAGAVVVAAELPAAALPAPPHLPRPAAIVRSAGAFRLGQRELVPEGTVVSIGPTVVGNGSIAVFAGPCAVENRAQMLETATAVARHGAVGLRGGAFKPRTSPYSFQGLLWAGLDLLVEARERTGLPILTEVVDPRHVERLAAAVDAFQIGTRNMQNFSLLTEVAAAGLPVVLKRGFGTTLDELLGASEYLMSAGNSQVVLCERGIRTFEPSARFTLDLTSVALMKRRTHLPVIVDPSHASGIAELVEPLALGAVAVGADALLVDVHVRPEESLCDGKQSLLPDAFAGLMRRLEMLARGVQRRLAAPLTAGTNVGADSLLVKHVPVPSLRTPVSDR